MVGKFKADLDQFITVHILGLDRFWDVLTWGMVPPLGKVTLSSLIKLTDQATWNKSPSSIPPWCLPQFLLCLLSVIVCWIEV